MSFINVANNLFREQKVVNSATDYVILNEDVFINMTDLSVPRNVTLPAPSASNVGKVFTVKDTSGFAGENFITIAPASGTIDGAPSHVIENSYGFASFYSDGSNYLLDKKMKPPLVPVRVSLPSNFQSIVYNTWEDIGLSITIPTAGSYRLTYNARGFTRNVTTGGDGSLQSRLRLVDVTGGNTPIANSVRNLASVPKVDINNIRRRESASFDVRVTTTGANTYKVQSIKTGIDGTPNTITNYRIDGVSYLEYRDDNF